MPSKLLLLVATLSMAACVANGPPAHDDQASDFAPVVWTGPNGKADFAGVPPVFDRNDVMTDAVFTASAAIDGDAIQQFLESSPYHSRSWLADQTLNGQRFSDAVVEVARAHGIDPVLLLARMQVESSLISATSRPSRTRIDTALGCGCADASKCTSSDLGLGNQLACGAKSLASGLAASQAATGTWVKDRSRHTYDRLLVTPHTDATAALYAYTPWVLVDRGGNWLVWNVTRRYLKYFDAAGTLHLP